MRVTAVLASGLYMPMSLLHVSLPQTPLSFMSFICLKTSLPTIPAKGKVYALHLIIKTLKRLAIVYLFPSLLLLLALTAPGALALTSPISGSLVRLPLHSKEESQLVLQSLAQFLSQWSSPRSLCLTVWAQHLVVCVRHVSIISNSPCHSFLI